jgi:hypothetical protein
VSRSAQACFVGNSNVGAPAILADASDTRVVVKQVLEVRSESPAHLPKNFRAILQSMIAAIRSAARGAAFSRRHLSRRGEPQSRPCSRGPNCVAVARNTG